MQRAVHGIGSPPIPWRSAIGPRFFEIYPPSRVAELLRDAIPSEGATAVLDSVRLELTCTQIRLWGNPVAIWNIVTPEQLRLDRLTRRLVDSGLAGDDLQAALRDYGLFDSENDRIRTSCDLVIVNDGSLDEFVAAAQAAYEAWSSKLS